MRLPLGLGDLYSVEDVPKPSLYRELELGAQSSF